MVSGVRILQVVRQLADAAAQVLLPSDDVFGRVGGDRDAAPCEQLQHLARPHALARRERRSHTAAVALDERELRVDIPFVGEECGAPVRQHEGEAWTIELGERAPQLARGRVGRGLAAQHDSPASVQLPRDFRRDAVAEPVERRPIERIRRDGCGRVRLESRPFTERGGGRHGIANSIQIASRSRQVASGRGRIAACQDRSSERDSCQGGGAHAARSHLCPERAFQQCLGVDRVVSRQQQQGAPFFRFGLAISLGRQPVECFRTRVEPLCLGQRVQLHGEVGASERDSSSRARWRPG